MVGETKQNLRTYHSSPAVTYLADPLGYTDIHSKTHPTGKAQVYITGIGGVAHAVPLNGNHILYQSLSSAVQ